MKIYFNNTEIDLPVNDSSYRYRVIKGEHALTLYYSLPQHVEIPIGAYCQFEGETYTLESPENFKKHNTRNFEYTLMMDSPQAKLSKYKFKDTTSRRLKFSLTAKPREHLQMLVDNLNQRETGWTVGTCIDAVEKVISYNHAFCSDAFSQIMEVFETEGEIVGKTINLCKVEYNKNNPLPLSYGRGNGFKSGLGRVNTDGSKPIEILYVQGGERNIDASKYGSRELLLPKGQTLEYEGRTYISDEDGFSIRRADKALRTNAEDSLDCSHIYPSRVGTISSVEVIDEKDHFYDFTDSSIPADLDFSKYRIDGESITIIFQDGMLAGKEFEIEQTKDAVPGYVHEQRRFKLVPQELDGQTMPNDIFKPVVGGKYAVFGMMMPDAYICDNATKTGASWDMFREAAKFLYENEEQKFTFAGELDGIWAKKDWLNIGGKIKLGSYVLFTDNQFQPDGVLIRIVGIKDYINNPHSPVIELSNATVGNSIYSDLRKIETNEVVVDDKFAQAIQYSKRGFRDAVETIGIMEEAMLKNFTESINPITIRTMAILLGDESLQFKFVNNKTNPQPVDHRILFDNATKTLTAPAGIIQHMTLGIDAAAPSHKPSEYKFWDIPRFISPPLDDDKKYYLYAKVSASSQTGQFYLSDTAKAMDAETGYYYLWVGFLNSAYNGERTDFVNMNRFTEILPGQMTIDLMRDELARLVIDLRNARIIAQNGAEIIGKITFSSGSSGYENLTDKPDLSTYDEAVNYIDNVLPTSIERLQAQIDDTIESHFYHYDPTLSNTPASDWTTATAKEAHLDDTFTNLDSGQSWRFTKDTNNVYKWTLMDDSAATKALVLAGEAQDTADGKRRVFVNTPYPPYDAGDLWVQGTSGDLMRCQTARGSGSYVASDWVKAVKYTDNTLAEAAQLAANNANTAVTNLNTYVDGAFADGIVSEAEAVSIEKYINSLNTEKANVDASYDRLYANAYLTGTAKTSLASYKTAYNTAHANLITAINTAIADKKTTAAEKTDVNNKFTLYKTALSNYSTAVENANKAIQDYLKTQSDTAYSRAGSALTAAENASNAANTAASAASGAQSTANSAQTTANSKCQVFYATSAPTSGMKTNDLWVNGTLIRRYNGSAWVDADKYDVQMTIVNGGLVSTGAIVFGDTGGMAATGSVRIWSGGLGGSSSNATFRVLSNGGVYSKNSFYVEDANGIVDGGFNSPGASGPDDSYNSVRLWIGGGTASSARFRVQTNGYVFGTQFVTNGTKGRMDSMGFQFGDYGDSEPYAFLHTNHNPFFRLRSKYTPLEIQCNGGLSGAAINIVNTSGNNATFQLGYYRYSDEYFGRPFIRMTNPIWKHFFSSTNTKNVVWDLNTGYLMVEQ